MGSVVIAIGIVLQRSSPIGRVVAPGVIDSQRVVAACGVQFTGSAAIQRKRTNSCIARARLIVGQVLIPNGNISEV